MALTHAAHAGIAGQRLQPLGSQPLTALNPTLTGTPLSTATSVASSHGRSGATERGGRAQVVPSLLVNLMPSTLSSESFPPTSLLQQERRDSQACGRRPGKSSLMWLGITKRHRLQLREAHRLVRIHSLSM